MNDFSYDNQVTMYLLVLEIKEKFLNTYGHLYTISDKEKGVKKARELWLYYI